MRNTNVKNIALCGMLAAVAIVIMCLGGFVPVATYVCPILCTLLGNVVLLICGKRLAWTWYGAVSLLCLLLAPDREAAIVYLFLGFYPYIKCYLDKSMLRILWKLLYFNLSSVIIYWVTVNIMGLEEIALEFASLGIGGLLLFLLLENATFILLDILLKRLGSMKLAK